MKQLSQSSPASRRACDHWQRAYPTSRDNTRTEPSSNTTHHLPSNISSRNQTWTPNACSASPSRNGSTAPTRAQQASTWPAVLYATLPYIPPSSRLPTNTKPHSSQSPSSSSLTPPATPNPPSTAPSSTSPSSTGSPASSLPSA